MTHKDKKANVTALQTQSTIERKIHTIRGQKVMLDSDLAELYEVSTKRLNEQVKRNLSRFPEDFMFQLTENEFETLRSQFATSNKKRGGRRYMPYVFTEQGVAMLSGVLNSEQAIQVNISIMRAFVKMRKMILANEELNKKFAAIEEKLGEHDEHFRTVFAAIKLLLGPPKKDQKRIGYIQKSEGEKS